MNLNQKEQELLIRTLTFYYQHYVWDSLLTEDPSEASEEDYRIRSLTEKLGIRGQFPDAIKCRW